MIRLDRDAIEEAIPLVAIGLEKYCRLQATLNETNVTEDRVFQTAFNGFYRVRRNALWRSAFFKLLEEQKTAVRSFGEILQALYDSTGRVEASFASKLVASIDPSNPVIDSFVLRNLGLRLLSSGAIAKRLQHIVEVYDRISRIFANYLMSDMGQHLICVFEERYPNRGLTEVKMLDLILWQSRNNVKDGQSTSDPK